MASRDADSYLHLFDGLAAEPGAGELFVSHVMNRAIAGGMMVTPLLVSGLIDVGTLEDWRRHVRARGTIITDLDGVVFVKSQTAHFPPFWSDDDIPIDDNVNAALRISGRSRKAPRSSS